MLGNGSVCEKIKFLKCKTNQIGQPLYYYRDANKARSRPWGERMEREYTAAYRKQVTKEYVKFLA